MKTIYLCGGINALSDSDAMDWREAVKTELADIYKFLDPARRDYRGKELESAFEIVCCDYEDLRQCDIVLVNAVRPSWGTAMELLAANRFFHKHTIVVCSAERPSPWLIVHSSKLVKTFAEAFAVLRTIA